MSVTEAASAPGACGRSCPGSGTFPPTNSLLPTPSFHLPTPSYHLPHTISLLPTSSYLIPTHSYPHTIYLLPTPACQLPQPHTNSQFLCPTSPPSFSSAYLLLQCPPTCLPTKPAVKHGCTCNTCTCNTAAPATPASLPRRHVSLLWPTSYICVCVCVCVCVCARARARVRVSQDLSGSLVDDFIFDEVFVSLARPPARALSLTVCLCVCV